MKRKIIKIIAINAADGDEIIALADDGTMWNGIFTEDWEWTQIPNIPQKDERKI